MERSYPKATAIEQVSSLFKEVEELAGRVFTLDEQAQRIADRLLGSVPTPIPDKIDGGDASLRAVVRRAHQSLDMLAGELQRIENGL